MGGVLLPGIPILLESKQFSSVSTKQKCKLRVDLRRGINDGIPRYYTLGLQYELQHNLNLELKAVRVCTLAFLHVARDYQPKPAVGDKKKNVHQKLMNFFLFVKTL